MAVRLSTDDDYQKLLNDNPKVIIKYFADWCGSCKLFAPKYRRLSEDQRFEKTLFLEVNAENDRQARKSAGVDNLPYFAVFKDGQLINGKATSKEEVVLDMLHELTS